MSQMVEALRKYIADAELEKSEAMAAWESALSLVEELEAAGESYDTVEEARRIAEAIGTAAMRAVAEAESSAGDLKRAEDREGRKAAAEQARRDAATLAREMNIRGEQRKRQFTRPYDPWARAAQVSPPRPRSARLPNRRNGGH